MGKQMSVGNEIETFFDETTTFHSLQEVSLIYYLQDYLDELRSFRDMNRIECDWDNGRIKTRELTAVERVEIEKEILALIQMIRTLSHYYAGTKKIKGDKSWGMAKDQSSSSP